MKLKSFIPSGPAIVSETVVILIATIGAAWVISQFPSVREFVNKNSITIKDPDGNTIRV